MIYVQLHTWHSSWTANSRLGLSDHQRNSGSMGIPKINPMKSKLMRKLLTYVNLQGESKRQANLERNNNLHDESMWFWCNLGVPITWTNIFSACSSKPRRCRHWKCNSVVIIRWNIKLVYNLFICFTLIL